MSRKWKDYTCTVQLDLGPMVCGCSEAGYSQFSTCKGRWWCRTIVIDKYWSAYCTSQERMHSVQHTNICWSKDTEKEKYSFEMISSKCGGHKWFTMSPKQNETNGFHAIHDKSSLSMSKEGSLFPTMARLIYGIMIFSYSYLQCIVFVFL